MNKNSLNYVFLLLFTISFANNIGFFKLFKNIMFSIFWIYVSDMKTMFSFFRIIFSCYVWKYGEDRNTRFHKLKKKFTHKCKKKKLNFLLNSSRLTFPKDCMESVIILPAVNFLGWKVLHMMVIAYFCILDGIRYQSLEYLQYIL